MKNFKINDQRINYIYYRDDKVLIVEMVNLMQMMLNRLNIESINIGMKINVWKMKLKLREITVQYNFTYTRNM